MKLYLMRHGQAASPQLDPQEGLSAQGRQDIESLAQRLLTQGVRFSQVLHSEKARAQQTAEIMAAMLAPDITPELRSGLKPNDDPRRLLPEIEIWQADTLLTSHLPFVPNLLMQLTGQSPDVAFVPGTIVCLEKKADGWQIDWLESP
jgi:phosphohistidine phosphatase